MLLFLKYGPWVVGVGYVITSIVFYIDERDARMLTQYEARQQAETFNTQRDILESNISFYANIVGEQNERYQQADEEVAKFEKELSQHDLEDLLYNKPSLVVPRINAATERLFDDFEKASRGHSQAARNSATSGVKTSKTIKDATN